jgi:hypothetical protein
MKSLIILAILLVAMTAGASDFVLLHNGDFVRPGVISQINIVEHERYSPQGEKWPSYCYVIVITDDGVHHEDFYETWTGAQIVKERLVDMLSVEGYSFSHKKKSP